MDSIFGILVGILGAFTSGFAIGLQTGKAAVDNLKLTHDHEKAERNAAFSKQIAMHAQELEGLKAQAIHAQASGAEKLERMTKYIEELEARLGIPPYIVPENDFRVPPVTGF